MLEYLFPHAATVAAAVAAAVAGAAAVAAGVVAVDELAKVD